MLLLMTLANIVVIKLDNEFELTNVETKVGLVDPKLTLVDEYEVVDGKSIEIDTLTLWHRQVGHLSIKHCRTCAKERWPKD
jgi:hypothetical protein